MSRKDEQIKLTKLMTSIDNLMNELKEVVEVGRENGFDDVWMLNYVIAELPSVFSKEKKDVEMHMRCGL